MCFRFLFFLFITVFVTSIGQCLADDTGLLKTDLRLVNAKTRVIQVIDGETITIEDGSVIHLPMIYIPQDNAQTVSDIQKNAKEYLEKEIKGRFVRLYQIRDQKRGQVNALGHTEGYILRDDGLWIQKAMVENGLAFVYPSQSHYEMAAPLYTAEARAREAKIGLWADPKWAVMNTDEVKSAKDRFVIVEGQVKNIVTRSNTIYMNFEEDWRTDFTIAIDSSRRRDFSKYGANIMDWTGQKIRVRGWVRDYNGPFLEIFHPTQVELLEE